MPIPNPVEQSVWVSLDHLDMRPDARAHNDVELSSLAKSMAKKQLQNILVNRETSNVPHYTVLAGVGRVLAARLISYFQRMKNGKTPARSIRRDCSMA